MEIRFKNYAAKGSSSSSSDAAAPRAKTISKELGEKLEENVRAKVERTNDEVVVLPNSEAEDMSRILNPRLRILERRTSEAIVELIKQKLSNDCENAASID